VHSNCRHTRYSFAKRTGFGFWISVCWCWIPCSEALLIPMILIELMFSLRVKKFFSEGIIKYLRISDVLNILQLLASIDLAVLKTSFVALLNVGDEIRYRTLLHLVLYKDISVWHWCHWFQHRLKKEHSAIIGICMWWVLEHKIYFHWFVLLLTLFVRLGL
jgi:hypothetical protein